MQHCENRFCQEIEPAPINGIDVSANTAFVLVSANGCPFLGPGEQPRRCFTGRARCHTQGGQAGFGLVDIGAGHVFHHRSERLALFRDQRGHPVFVSKSNPAIGRGFYHHGLGRFTVNHRQIDQVFVLRLGQFAIGAADNAFVQHKEILKRAWLAMACHNPVGGKTHFGGGVVLHRFLNREHVVFINADGAAEHQALGIVPTQCHRRVGGQCRPCCQCPFGIGPRDIGKIQSSRRRPAIKRIIGVFLPDRRQQPHDI